MEILITVLYALFGLTFIVVVHEMGHLLIARWTGISVEVFSVFFGRPIFQFKWKGIQWQLGWLPFGGYCKMKGQDDFAKMEVHGEPDEFYSRPAWARFLAVLGGPLFNALLGFVIFIMLVYLQGEQIQPNTPIVVDPSYSKQLQLNTGDLITSIDDVQVKSWNDIFIAIFMGLHKTEQSMTVQRDGEILPLIYQFDKEKQIKRNFGFTFPKLLLVESVSERIPFEVLPSGETIKRDNPNYKANIKSMDILVAMNGNPLQSISEYEFYLNAQSKSNKNDEFLILEGLQTNARLRSLDGIIFKSIGNLQKYLNKDKNKLKYTATFIQSDGNEVGGVLKKKKLTLQALPKQVLNPDTKKIEVPYYHGLDLVTQNIPAIDVEVYHRDYSIFEAIVEGSNKSIDRLIFAITQFKLMSYLSSNTLRENITGPIGILKRIGEESTRGFFNYMAILGFISLLLAVFNLLPIPAMDGWHLWITLIEIIRRKPISLKVIQVFQWVGLVFILLLALLVTFNDILKLF